MLQTMRSSLRTAFRQPSRGFTLIEIAIVLVVIGLIVSGGLLAVSPIIQSAKINQTRQKIATIEAALLSYAIQNGCLPCPARVIASPTGQPSNDGTVDYATACNASASCLGGTTSAGFVPWVRLGISEDDATDAWNRLITYGVTPSRTTADSVQRTNGSFPAAATNITIEDLNGAGTALGYTDIAYVLVSHGADGAFGRTSTGAIIADANATPADQAQRENGDGDLVFANGPPSATGVNYFDDIVSFKSLQPLIISCGAGSCGNPS